MVKKEAILGGCQVVATGSGSLKVLSSEMDPAEIRLIR
jgi:hypothetical protein